MHCSIYYFFKFKIYCLAFVNKSQSVLCRICYYVAFGVIVGTRIKNSLVHCLPLLPGKVVTQF